MVQLEDLAQELNRIKILYSPTQIVCEDYKIRSYQARINANKRVRHGPAMQVIGMVKALYLDSPIAFQDPNILDTAERQSGVSSPGNHAIGHWMDAYNHVFRWLRNHDMIMSPSEVYHD